MSSIRMKVALASGLVSAARALAPDGQAQAALNQADALLDRSKVALDMAEHARREIHAGRAQRRLLGMLAGALVRSGGRAGR
jgi:hypothetical protein